MKKYSPTHKFTSYAVNIWHLSWCLIKTYRWRLIWSPLCLPPARHKERKVNTQQYGRQMQKFSKMYLQSLLITAIGNFKAALSVLYIHFWSSTSTYTDCWTYPDYPSSCCSSCHPWHHSIAWLANDKVPNHYLSCPGPILRQCTPPPGALQPYYTLWRTTASSLCCSCWLKEYAATRIGLREGARKMCKKCKWVNGTSLSYSFLKKWGISPLQRHSTNTVLSMHWNRDMAIYSCQVQCLKMWGDNNDSIPSNCHCATRQGVLLVTNAVNSFSIRAIKSQVKLDWEQWLWLLCPKRVRRRSGDVIQPFVKSIQPAVGQKARY